MKSTSKLPNVRVENFKRTKIIATIGPSTDSYKAVHDLITSGANGIRFNFSHGTYEEREKQLKWVRKAQEAYGKPVATILDLQGPKIRLGDFDGVFTVQAGQSIALEYNADYERSGHLPTQYDLAKKVKRGESLYLYDGKVRTVITSVKDGVVHVRAENDGILVKRKGINLPDTDFSGDIITTKDKKDIAFGSTRDFDYVALSFVQTGKDIEKLRTMLKNLGCKAKIIAKVETKAAVSNIEDIVREADVIMVARGDLAIETSSESVPIVQRKIIGLGQHHSKPTIVATQMLLSMTESPEPTRAEVSDVASAVIIGADCVMLSDETASGKYPIESVQEMKKIIKYTEENSPLKVSFPSYEKNPTMQEAICDTVIGLADSVNARAIVCETSSGKTALQIAARRPERSIIAVTADSLVSHQLALVYGVKSYVRPSGSRAATKLTNWLRQYKFFSKGDMIVTTSGRYPGVVGATDTIKVRMLD